MFLRGESLDGKIDFPRGVREGVLKKIGAEVLLRLERVGVKPRKLELNRRIEEDTAVRAVSPPSMFLP